jgi:hypothetical protein
VTPRIVVRTYYRSLIDGELWCESRRPREVLEQTEGKDATFEKLEVFETTDGWQPWDYSVTHEAPEIPPGHKATHYGTRESCSSPLCMRWCACDGDEVLRCAQRVGNGHPMPNGCVGGLR